MTDDVITQATTPEAQNAELTTISTLVGEGRKYRTVEDLAQSRIEADKFIEQLKFENQSMREAMTELEAKANSSKTIEDVLAKLNSKPEGEQTNNQGRLDPESVRNLVQEAIKGETQAAKRETNRLTVNAKVLEKFNGDAGKAKEFIRSRLGELSLDAAKFKELTETSPEAAMRLININTTNAQGSFNPNTFADRNGDAPQVNGDVRNQAYYSDLRKKMGTSKFFADHKLQAQIRQDSEKLGRSFYSK